MPGRRVSRVLPLDAMLAAVLALLSAQGAAAIVSPSINIKGTVSPTPVATGKSLTVKAVAMNATTGKTATTFNQSATLSDDTGGLNPATASFIKGVMTAPATITYPDGA